MEFLLLLSNKLNAFTQENNLHLKIIFGIVPDIFFNLSFQNV